VPLLAERVGRRVTHGLYFCGMGVCIVASFGVAFYAPAGLPLFIGSLFFLGVFGGNFAMYNLWLPEQYPTAMRATAFAFATSFGRYIGAGANFVIGSAVHAYGSVGVPIAWTSLVFLLGIALLPFARETRGNTLPP
jgi:MFS family permease